MSRLIAVLLLAACTRGAAPASAVAEPPPLEPSRPAVDAVDVPALIARDKLEREPWVEACCGAGRIEFDRVRWAELDGEPPSELLLSMMEYVGEGAASWHQHIYDVSDPAQPRSLGPDIEAGGYVEFGYMRIIDPEADGRDALLFVNEPAQGTRTQVVELESGRLVTRWEEELGRDASLLLHDVDADGVEDLVVVVPAVDDDGRDVGATVRVHRLPGGERVETPVPDDLLVTLLVRAQTRDDLDHRRLAVDNLSRAIRARPVAAEHLEPALHAQISEIASGEIRTLQIPDPGWSTTPAQDARLASLLDSADPRRVRAATHLILQASTDPTTRSRAIETVARQIDAVRRAPEPDDIPFHGDRLTPEERAVACDVVGEAIRAPDTDDDARGDLAWEHLDALPCYDLALELLEQPDAHTRQTVRGAIHAIDKTSYRSLGSERHRLTPAQRDRLGHSLPTLLRHPDPTLRAEAARAMRLTDLGIELVRARLAEESDAEVRRSLLVAIADADDPGDPALYLELLQSPQSSQVLTALHAQIIRSGDPTAVRQALALATTPHTYGSHRWLVVYHLDRVSPELRALYAADAVTRLAHGEPRMRQYACQVLAKLPHPAAGAALTRLAAQDETTWVRSACEEAHEALDASSEP